MVNKWCLKILNMVKVVRRRKHCKMRKRVKAGRKGKSCAEQINVRELQLRASRHDSIATANLKSDCEQQHVVRGVSHRQHGRKDTLIICRLVVSYLDVHVLQKGSSWPCQGHEDTLSHHISFVNSSKALQPCEHQTRS